MKRVTLIEGKICKDHTHMYVSIPPKLSVSEFVGYMKDKSALMIFDRHPDKTSKWDRHFRAKEYYVSTVGNVIEDTILEYIKN
jgi:putative transposase